MADEETMQADVTETTERVPSAAEYHEPEFKDREDSDMEAKKEEKMKSEEGSDEESKEKRKKSKEKSKSEEKENSDGSDSESEKKEKKKSKRKSKSEDKEESDEESDGESDQKEKKKLKDKPNSGDKEEAEGSDLESEKKEKKSKEKSKEDKDSKEGSDSDSENEDKKSKKKSKEDKKSKKKSREDKKDSKEGSDSESENEDKKLEKSKDENKKRKGAESDGEQERDRPVAGGVGDTVPRNLTEEEAETFKALFDMYAEEDHKISKTGIKLFFRYMGECVTDEDVCRWLLEVDKDKDGRFDFEEFCQLYSSKREPEDKRREELLVCVNTVFPTNGSDSDMLDLRKVKAIMKRVSMGLQRENTVNMSTQEIEEVIERFDKHKSNQISRHEFVDLLINTSKGN